MTFPTPRGHSVAIETYRNNMPAFGGVYSANELFDVATYIVDELSDH